MRYSDIPAEIKEELCNGCGPEVLSFIVPQLVFSEACCIHDLDYWRGGALKHYHKANKRFLRNCTRLILFSRYAYKFDYYVYAKLYYEAIKKYGWFFWYHREKPLSLDEVCSLASSDDFPSNMGKRMYSEREFRERVERYVRRTIRKRLERGGKRAPGVSKLP